MKRILLLGSTGQVGWELQRALSPLAEVIALDRSKAGPQLPDGTAACGDLVQVERLSTTVRALGPDAVVNAAAYTAVDKAEVEREAAQMVNAVAPGALAKACRAIDALLVHYSTDYVFDGTGDASWREEDRTAPVNFYGQSKLDGEQRIRDTGCRHLILRTSWVYAARGANFLRTMMRLGCERETLNVVDDQFGAPTGAELLADISAHALRQIEGRDHLCGTYHATASGSTNWFDYARIVIAQARAAGWPIKIAQERIAPIPASSYPLPARRPQNSRLDCSKLEAAFRFHLPAWEDGVRRAVAELTANREHRR